MRARADDAPITGSLDPTIAPLVHAMRDAGFPTLSCCEGHFVPDAFRHLRPNVVFWVKDRGLLHAWVREISRPKAPDVLPVEVHLSPTWNDAVDVVHEDNWGLYLDLTVCDSAAEAARRRDATFAFLLTALRHAQTERPRSMDAFMRSWWSTGV